MRKINFIALALGLTCFIPAAHGQQKKPNILPVGDDTLVAEVKWIPERDTDKRLEGNSIRVKVVYQF